MEKTTEATPENTINPAENSVENSVESIAEENNLLDYGLPIIDQYLAENGMSPTSKRKFKETALIHGTVYKFSHFGVEVIKDQATIFGKYTSEFFDVERYQNNDELLEALLSRIEEFYHNPVLTKHPIIRFFSKFKK